MLLVDDLHVYYGSIHAIKGVSFAVYPGEIVTLIGANGAGKTTVLQTISGLLRPRQGRICFMGKEIHKVPPASILHMGLAQVPEGRRIFTQLTVEENLALGAYSRSDRASIAADMDKFYRHFPILKERRKQMAGTLSGGEQQMLAIARALMSRPDLLLLDEPSMGLSPLLVQEIFRAINNVRSEGTTILLVEQNARMALCIADRAYVLETGRVAISGSAAQLLGDDKVRRAYLGIVD
ncbi:MAG: ABC transporter ATP-binding protein [Clostridiaceae bacterium]|nr:ABC transporter ATP-binding protein [Clostridiaceae bacterium]